MDHGAPEAHTPTVLEPSEISWCDARKAGGEEEAGVGRGAAGVLVPELASRAEAPDTCSGACEGDRMREVVDGYASTAEGTREQYCANGMHAEASALVQGERAGGAPKGPERGGPESVQHPGLIPYSDAMCEEHSDVISCNAFMWSQVGDPMAAFELGGA